MPTLYNDVLFEHANLVLNTCDGTMNDLYGSDYTFNNVNIREVLGTMYDKYEYYNLALIGIAIGRMPTSVLVSHDKNIVTLLSGLPWKNCNYDYKNNRLTDKATICMNQFSNINSSNGKCIIYQPSEAATNCFTKGSDVITLRLQQYLLTTPLTNTAVPSNSGSGAVYPQRIYYFKITPIKSIQDIPTMLFLHNNDFFSVTSTYNTIPNVNMRLLLGELIDKYEYFNIEIAAIQSSAISATVQSDTVISSVKMSGFEFINSLYTHGSRTHNDYVTLGYIDFSVVNSTTSTNYSDPPNCDIVMISRPSDSVNLKIELHNLTTNTLVSSTGFTRIDYLFRIMPVILEDE